MTMPARTQIVSILFALLVFAAVFELVRRRYLRERYALLWLGAALVLLVLALWRDLLTRIAHAMGVHLPSNAIFVIAFAFLLLLLLHFSAVVSRLSDQTRVLAQRLALLEQRERDRARPGADDEHETADGDVEPHVAGRQPSPELTRVRSTR
jgi:hypothetical protein